MCFLFFVSQAPHVSFKIQIDNFSKTNVQHIISVAWSLNVTQRAVSSGWDIIVTNVLGEGSRVKLLENRPRDVILYTRAKT